MAPVSLEHHNALLGLRVTTGPDLTPESRREMANQIVREYPPALMARQKGGTVLMNVLIDAHGVVRETCVTRTSGYRETDVAAARVLRRTRIEPAQVGECMVPDVHRLPISFSAVAM
jgi:TonB family protein